MIGLMTLTDLVRMLVGRFRPLFSLLRALTQVRWCLPLPFSTAHILPPFLRHHRRKCKRRALIIGLVYGGSSAPSEPEGRLKGQHIDALSMAVVLHERYGYAREDIKYLLDRPGFEYPTRENILKYMKLLVQDAQEGDRLFFYFSGHSNQNGENKYLLTSDVEERVILDDELKEHLVKPLPHGSSLTAIFDACHSGTILGLPHFLCNRVYLPFVNKGIRRTHPLWRMQARRQALPQGSKEALSKQSTEPAELGGGSTGRVPILVEQAIPGGSKAIPAFSVTTNFENGKPMVFCDNSRICTSPIQDHEICDGFGCVESEEPGPNICISSCGDTQATWEGPDGGSVTAELIKIFWENPHPALSEVMSVISFRRHATACMRHQEAVDYREKWRAFNMSRIRKGKRPSPLPWTLEMVNFEIPQLSSLRPLSLNRLWDP